MPWNFLLQAAPAIGSLLGGLFGGKPKFQQTPWAQQAGNDITNNYLNPLQKSMDNFSYGKGFKFSNMAMNQLLQNGKKGDTGNPDFSANIAAQQPLAMRAMERAAQSRSIQRDARQVAASLPAGAEHLSAAIGREMQNKADETNSFQDAAMVSNIVSSIPGMYQQFKGQGDNEIANMRSQYLQGVQSRYGIQNSGGYQQPSFMQKLMGAVSPALSMLPGLMNKGGSSSSYWGKRGLW